MLDRPLSSEPLGDVTTTVSQSQVLPSAIGTVALKPVTYRYQSIHHGLGFRGVAGASSGSGAESVGDPDKGRFRRIFR